MRNTPGKHMTKKFIKLLKWLDKNEDEITAVLGAIVLFGFLAVGVLAYSIFLNY